jgi:hypothetical protein
MKKFLSMILAAGMALATSHALAADQASTAKHPHKKVAKKSAKKSSKKAAPAKEADEPEPDISKSAVSEYSCADNHKLTIYRNDEDKQHAAIRWNNHLLRMDRVPTESGAERLENTRRGLVFIGIPAKAMLLDSKKGRQLANDCKLPDQ